MFARDYRSIFFEGNRVSAFCLNVRAGFTSRLAGGDWIFLPGRGHLKLAFHKTSSAKW